MVDKLATLTKGNDKNIANQKAKKMLMPIAQKCNGNNKDAAAAFLRQVAQLLDGQKTKIPASERIVRDLAEYTNELSKDKTKKGQLRLQQLYSVVVPHLSSIYRA